MAGHWEEGGIYVIVWGVSPETGGPEPGKDPFGLIEALVAPGGGKLPE